MMSIKLPFTILTVGVNDAGVIPFAISQAQEDGFKEIKMLQTIILTGQK